MHGGMHVNYSTARARRCRCDASARILLHRARGFDPLTCTTELAMMFCAFISHSDTYYGRKLVLLNI
jgi:hypothetical protein